MEREVRDLYGDATGHRSGVRLSPMRRAVELAEALCDHAGSDRGLYWLALAHHFLAHHPDRADVPEATVAHYLESARALDGYLAAHPIAALNDERERAVIEALRDDLRGQLAWVRVVARPAGVVARVADVVVNDAEVPMRPGEAALVITSPDHDVPPGVNALTLAAGGATSLALTEDADAPIPDGARRIMLRRRAPPPIETSVPSAVTAPVAEPPVMGPPVPEIIDPSPPHPLRPWAVAATATAGAFALLGVGLTLRWSDQTSAYEAQACATRVGPTCESSYDTIVTTNALLTASFIAAGAFAVGAATLWGLDRRSATRARRQTASFGCAVLAGGLRCAW